VGLLNGTYNFTTAAGTPIMSLPEISADVGVMQVNNA